jgi:hypothetical protein
LNDSEPQPDAKQPDKPVGTTGQAVPPPELVFKPDERQAVRVARVRMFTVLVTAVLMLGTLVLILTYRPRPSVRSVPMAQARAVPWAESATPVPAPAATQRAPVFHKPDVVEVARSAAATIDTLVSRAAETWLRATELSPQGAVTRDNAEDAAEKLRKAVILADSARRDITLARQQAEVVFRASREAESGIAFRLSVLYAAVDRYVKSVADDADDRYSFYAKSEISVKAVLLGDQAESEVQQNVAMSYLRRSEERQNSIQQLAQQVREALRNIDNAGR